MYKFRNIVVFQLLFNCIFVLEQSLAEVPTWQFVKDKQRSVNIHGCQRKRKHEMKSDQRKVIYGRGGGQEMEERNEQR